MSDRAKKVYDANSLPQMFDDIKRELVGAARDTVNIKAAKGRKEAIKNVKNDFTTRNNFTTSQIQFTQASEGIHNIQKIQSFVGVTEKASYMARQETGGERRNESGKNLAIPTDSARGGNRVSPVSRSMYLRKLKRLRKKRKETHSGFEKSWFVRKAYIAAKYNLILPYAGKLFKVSDFFKPTRENVFFKMDMIYVINQEETTTPPTPWLLPACEKVHAGSQAIFNSQMKKRGL